MQIEDQPRHEVVRDLPSGLKLPLRDRDGEVRLAHAGAPARQDEPAVRPLGKVLCRVICGLDALSLFTGQAADVCAEPLECHGVQHVFRYASEFLELLGLRQAKLDDPAQSACRQPRRDVRVECVEGDGGRDDGGKLGVEAVVDDLAQLFLGPGRGALAAEAVEHEQRRGPDLLEEVAIRGLACGAEAGAQVVEQIGGVGEEDDAAAVHAVVGDGRGKVSLARAVRAGEGEPSPRVVGVDSRDVVGLAELGLAYLGVGEAVGVEVLEAEAGEMAEVAVSEEPFALLVFEARFLALAGSDGAEVGVADGDVGADPTVTAAKLASAIGVVRLIVGGDMPTVADRTGGGETAEYL